MDVLGTILTIIGTVLASSGFWTYLQHRRDKKDLKTQMLIGLGHDRIIFLASKYIQRESITQAEYENLYEYLYKPYEAMGGNGTAKRLMQEVDKLPIKEHNDEED